MLTPQARKLMDSGDREKIRECLTAIRALRYRILADLESSQIGECDIPEVDQCDRTDELLCKDAIETLEELLET